MDIKGLKSDFVEAARKLTLADPDELESYLRDEFRELDLSKGWEAFIERVKSGELKGADNPNNILLYHLVGAKEPARLSHRYTGGDFPDIDLDFEPESRDKIKDMLKQKFGDENCCNVLTTGGTHVKGAIQDLARIAGIPPSEVTEITTQIQHNVNNDEENTLDWIMENNEPVSDWLNNNPQIKEWVDKMQEVKRSIGKHASAYIISSVPVNQHIPIVTHKSAGKQREILTGFPESSAVKSLNEVGLIKFDLLGLENLTVIRDTIDLIKERHGIEIDWDTVDLNDPKVYKLLRRGLNGGVFQIDSPLASMVMGVINPTNFEDLSALNALIRPACLQVKSHESYRDHKTGRFNRDVFPVWKDLEGKISDFTYNMLDATYGIPIYQEQTMAMLAEFCGVHLDETNKMRKIIGIPSGKKQQEHHDYIAAQQKKWMEYASEKFGEELAWQWWETAVGSLQYGFNRSHSIAYAMIAYRELWLKCYYPKEFYCALLRTTVAKKETTGRSKLMKFTIEARALDVPVEAPHVNISRVELDYHDDTIYVGFEQIKGVGHKAARDIYIHQPYESFEDFLDTHKKGSGSKVNKTAIDALIVTNAFRDFGDRHTLLEEYWRSRLPKSRRDEEIEMPDDFGMLKLEHKALTIVLSQSNPIDLPYGYISLTRALDTGSERICKIKGVAEKITYHTSRSGNPYAKLILNDLENSIGILVWKNYHNQLKEIDKGDILSLTVKHMDGETFSLIKINEVEKEEENDE